MPRRSIADLAYRVLEENHRPMHYRKITEEIMKIKEIKAENPHHEVNALIGVDKRFTKYHRGIWGLTKWKYREANLPYTLTSYCLSNGTIFLTSYLKPYFSWCQGERIVEVPFIDSEGEEIRAKVNYQQKFISGFAEWFQKQKLEINDTILIGLIDEREKRYFIIAEKEIKGDIEKDMSDKIYQILSKEGKPLNFLQIYSEVTQKEPEPGSLFEKYIEEILDNDIRFILLDNKKWALLEWLDETKQLCHNLYYALSWKDFYHTLCRCFQFLGFKVESTYEIQQQYFIARAQLAVQSYCLIITGLPVNYNIDAILSLDWQGLKGLKEKANADSVILFSKEFILPELINRASEEGVQLFELAILEYIINEHKKAPFSLLDLRIAFSPLHHPRNNLAELKRIREKQQYNWLLIKMIINVLQKARYKYVFMDINLLLKELNIIASSQNQANIDLSLVKKIINLLKQEPFKLVELSKSGNIVLAYPDHLLVEKINKICQFIIGK